MQRAMISSSVWTLTPGGLRVAVAQAVFDAFNGRSLVMGRCDCVRMVSGVLERLGLDPALDRGGVYRTETGAVRALRRAGFGSLEDALDSLGLERIAPARRRPADILAMPGAGRLSALHVALSNGVMMGWGEGEAVCTTWRPVLDAGAPVVCWRVLAPMTRTLPDAPVRVVERGAG